MPTEPDPPVLVAIAGPNGAGKSTFFEAFLRPLGLRFVNADELARELRIDAYAAAEAAEQIRQEMLNRRESFVFETVFSDPGGTKLSFLREAAESGYVVVLYFVGLESAVLSGERVSLRVLQGGHDVPTDKLMARYARTLDNLRRAVAVLPRVLIYDNSDLVRSFRFVAEYHAGVEMRAGDDPPRWFRALLTPEGHRHQSE